MSPSTCWVCSAPRPAPLWPTGRGNAALRKIGAVQEGVLRRSFLRHGHYYDQVLWSILAADWHLQRTGEHPVIH